jgi:hypothetical protein
MNASDVVESGSDLLGLAVCSEHGTADRQRLHVRVHGLFSLGLGQVEEEDPEAVQRGSNLKHVVRVLIERIISNVKGLCVSSDCVFVVATAILDVADVVQDGHDTDTAARILARLFTTPLGNSKGTDQRVRSFVVLIKSKIKLSEVEKDRRGCTMHGRESSVEGDGVGVSVHALIVFTTLVDVKALGDFRAFRK